MVIAVAKKELVSGGVLPVNRQAEDVRTHLATAKRVMGIERDAIEAATVRLDNDFNETVDALLNLSGRLIVSGMGKSGHIARKTAATLASTGTPSLYLHPGEAVHGDLGMVRADDAVLCISYSGETEEVVRLLPFFSNNGNIIISMTGNRHSTLALASHHHLDAGVAVEACPLQLAPTSSTTVSLAMGDALAVALMEARGFRPEHFARFHPGGSLGRRLLNNVEHEMKIRDLPVVTPQASFMKVLQELTRRKLGIVAVQEPGQLGVITDGDVRRAVEQHTTSVFELQAREIMTASPICVSEGTRVDDALRLADAHNVGALLVVNNSQLVGIFIK